MKYFPYFYKITIDRVIDGDTVEAVFDLGFNITHKVTVRLAGYDAPETYRPKTETEKQAGQEIKKLLSEVLNTYAGFIYCRSTKIDLYGRSTGILYLGDDPDKRWNLNEYMKDIIIQRGFTKAELRK